MRKVDKKDRRANQLMLTDKGREVLTEAKEIQRQHMERMHQVLKDVDFDNFMKGLRLLATMPPRDATDI